jgi:hypothetical protein
MHERVVPAAQAQATSAVKSALYSHAYLFEVSQSQAQALLINALKLRL